MDWAKEYYCENIDPIFNEPEAEQMDDMQPEDEPQLSSIFDINPEAKFVQYGLDHQPR